MPACVAVAMISHEVSGSASFTIRAQSFDSVFLNLVV